VFNVQLISSDDITIFCDTWYLTKNFHQACKAIGRHREYVETAIERQESFRTALIRVQERAVDDIEATIIDRAANGWQEEVFFKGECVGSKTVYSPTLALKVLQVKRKSWREMEENIDIAGTLKQIVHGMNISVPNVFQIEHTDSDSDVNR